MTQKPNEQLTVVILSAHADQGTLAKGTSRAGFSVVCVSNNRELSDALAKNPWGLVHNLRSFDVKQNYLLQQRLARNQSLAAVTRFIIAPEVNSPALALVADCAVRQAFSLSSSMSGNLGEQLNVLKQSDNTRSEAQKIVHSERVFQALSPTNDYLVAVQDAYQAFPHDPIVRLEYAVTRFHVGQLEDASRLAKRLLQIETHNVRAMNLLARVQLKLGDLDGSLKLLDVANKLCPSSPERLTLIGDAYVAKGDVSAAKRAYIEALDVYPPTQPALEKLLEIPLDASEVETTVQIMSGVMKEKDRAVLLNNTAIAAVSSKKYTDAIRIYNYALEHLQDISLRASILYNLALAYKKMGDIALAQSHFKQCLQLDPTHSNARQHITEIETLKAV